MRKILLLAEKIFTIVSLLHYLGGPLAVILSGGENEGDTPGGTNSYLLVQLLFFVNYTISFLLLVLRWKSVAYIISKDRVNNTLLAVAVLSYFWSAAPSVTLVRCIALVGTSIFGFYLATRYSPKEQLYLLAWTLGLAMLLSVIFAIALPKYGIMSGIHTGKMRGIFTHKNALGKSMVLSSIIFLLLALDARKKRLLMWGGFGFSILLLSISKSSSATITLSILAIVFLIIRAVRMPYILMIPTICLLSVIGLFLNLWLSDNIPSLLSSIGKDTTLTGRTDLWPAVLDKIWQRPWFGYGFSGFWGSWKSEAAYVWRVTGWDPPNAHNGLLDILLDLGLLGASIYLIGFGFSFFRSIAWVRQHHTAESFWPFLYLTYFWFSNQTESAFLRQNDIYWLLYLVVTLSLISSKYIVNFQSERVHLPALPSAEIS
jgi:exopolysaccharide production protein ExoQ